MMSTVTIKTDETLDQLGITAGLVWEILSVEGTMSLAKLCRMVDAPRDLVMQGVGWLAREDKLCFQDNGRGRLVSLA